MKRILLACCLIAATCSVTYTQTYAQVSTSPRPIVSKNEFVANIGMLRAFADGNKVTEAKAKWEEIHIQLKAALGATKYRIKDASDANNEADKAKYIEVLKTQQTVYYEIAKMRDDLIGNKVKMGEKLNEFGATIQ